MRTRPRTFCRTIAPILLVPVLAMAQEMDPALPFASRPNSPAPTASPAAATPFYTHIVEASARFGLPERWIRAVIAVESAGDPRAVSTAGAMGLMQIMPATWAELRAAHGLGVDPFDPRDNILAGTAYLRELYDRFGIRGFPAAYNAGSDRYARHLATGRPLPRETRAYVARLAPLIGQTSGARRSVSDSSAARDWRDAGIFAQPPARGTSARTEPPGRRTERPDAALDLRSTELFVPVRTGDRL
jgi:soluble lytic murein transglycosylase-like protein